jgi:amidase
VDRDVLAPEQGEYERDAALSIHDFVARHRDDAQLLVSFRRACPLARILARRCTDPGSVVFGRLPWLSSSVMPDLLGAFVPHFQGTLPGSAAGPLAGMDFAVKDIYDIAGHVTGCGNPDWLRTHGPAEKSAPVVDALLAAGATMVGKTITDEIAYSLNGQNFHYGTPVNSNAPGCIPGGSSSGSASAVAGGAADFALGSDTGGSVRVPASLCGIYGIRTSHGRIPLEGVMPLAPSFDTIGWFARDASLLNRVGAVLLGEDTTTAPLRELLVAEDGFALANLSCAAALQPAVNAAATALGPSRAVRIGGSGGELPDWMMCFRRLQAREIWAQHGPWIEATKPRFGPEIAARFEWSKSMYKSPDDDDVEMREQVTRSLDDLLDDGGVLCLAAANSIAPLVGLAGDAAQQFRGRTLSRTYIANLARLPQVTIVAGRVDNCPIGLGLISRRGSDRQLLALAEKIATARTARRAGSGE